MRDGKSGRSTCKRDRFDRYRWRDDVFADPKTPANAKCLAFGIAKYVNQETGEAFPSTKTLAKICGFSERWVRKTIPVLQATGWMEVQLGTRGRGDSHCNRYRINRKKRTPCAFSTDPAKADPAFGFKRSETHTEKPYFLTQKADPVSEEPLNPIQRGVTAARTSRVDRERIINGTADAAALPEPLRPTPRAPNGALTEVPIEQNQPSPCRAFPKDMGRAVNAHAPSLDLEGDLPSQRGTTDAFDTSGAVREPRGYANVPAATARCADTLELFREEQTEG
jgi:hypothetical protein